MTSDKSIYTTWHPKDKLMITHISGNLDTEDIHEWESSFHAELEKIPSDSVFKILINMHGFKAVDLNAHKRFRNVIPLTLANYDWKVGYLDLFEKEAKAIIYKRTRGIRCIAAAHAHQDETKMSLYQSNFSSDNEQFFTNPEQAIRWIEAQIR